jgi:hypothetical protein
VDSVSLSFFVAFLDRTHLQRMVCYLIGREMTGNHFMELV